MVAPLEAARGRLLLVDDAVGVGRRCDRSARRPASRTATRCCGPWRSRRRRAAGPGRLVTRRPQVDDHPDGRADDDQQGGHDAEDEPRRLRLGSAPLVVDDRRPSRGGASRRRVDRRRRAVAAVRTRAGVAVVRRRGGRRGGRRAAPDIEPAGAGGAGRGHRAGARPAPRLDRRRARAAPAVVAAVARDRSGAAVSARAGGRRVGHEGQGRRAGQALGRLDEGAAQLGRRVALVRVGATGPLEHRRQRPEVGRRRAGACRCGS